MKNNNNTFMKSEFTISILILLLNFFIIICTDSFLEQLSIAYIVLFLISLYLFAFFFKEKLLYNFALNTILYFFLIIFISNIINIIMNIEQFILVLYGYKLYYIILNCFLFLSLFLQIIYFLLININKILKRILILISFLLFFILLIWFFYLFFNYLIVALDNQKYHTSLEIINNKHISNILSKFIIILFYVFPPIFISFIIIIYNKIIKNFYIENKVFNIKTFRILLLLFFIAFIPNIYRFFLLKFNMNYIFSNFILSLLFLIFHIILIVLIIINRFAYSNNLNIQKKIIIFYIIYFFNFYTNQNMLILGTDFNNVLMKIIIYLIIYSGLLFSYTKNNIISFVLLFFYLILINILSFYSVLTDSLLRFGLFSVTISFSILFIIISIKYLLIKRASIEK